VLALRELIPPRNSRIAPIKKIQVSISLINPGISIKFKEAFRK